MSAVPTLPSPALNPLEATIAFLADALPGVAVVPATGEGLPAAGALPDTVVVGLAGGPGTAGGPVYQHRAALTYYGPDPVDLHRRVVAATLVTPFGLPQGPRNVLGRWWLRNAAFGGLVGPQIEPETRRLRADCPVALTWNLAELAQ